VTEDGTGKVLLRFSDRDKQWYEPAEQLRKSNSEVDLVICRVKTGEVIYATRIGAPTQYVTDEASGSQALTLKLQK
jgi:hypothetical protein